MFTTALFAVAKNDNIQIAMNSINGSNVVYSYNGTLCSNGKEQITDIFNCLYVSDTHTVWKMSETDYIVYNCIYMKFKYR